MALKDELIDLINKKSRENTSNTPDFILGEYLMNCLESFEKAIKSRDSWYGVHLEPGFLAFLKEIEKLNKIRSYYNSSNG